MPPQARFSNMSMNELFLLFASEEEDFIFDGNFLVYTEKSVISYGHSGRLG